MNPTIAGGNLLGERVHASLAGAPAPFEMVNVFRRTEAVPEIVDEAIALEDGKRIRYLWLQLGIVHAAAAHKARDAGLEVVMDRCLKIEFGRLLSHG